LDTKNEEEKQEALSSITVNREIFAALKVGEFAFFQLAVDKIPRLLQKLNGYCRELKFSRVLSSRLTVHL
jgi:hypothetical protein